MRGRSFKGSAVPPRLPLVAQQPLEDAVTCADSVRFY